MDESNDPARKRTSGRREDASRGPLLAWKLDTVMLFCTSIQLSCETKLQIPQYSQLCPNLTTCKNQKISVIELKACNLISYSNFENE